ncbi:outer membrane lipoprotein SlyB [Actimicrobium sp. GrIS 1.19]|uniref:glycine zipper 2TM domain-containing protein n=1 Tax=Actimicrobium sp. GrIS 1.19 TaxID=3071708 RepID=UPI002E09D670|nr:outer membrane lipoprotein SlyB [Actimicrobium sp. GrIS 1.19]
MTFIRKCVLSCAALLPLAPLALISSDVQAQQYNNSSAPRIDGFNVNEVRTLSPGTDLNFTVYGTPGGNATLRIAGAVRNLALSEVEPGQYEGTYTISGRDRLSARSAVTANLRTGNQVASAVLGESLQVGVGYHPRAQRDAILPKIERFEVQPVTDLSGGNELKFTLFGTPGGKADMTIGGTTGRFFLPEVNAGEYVGSYTIRRRDRVQSDSPVVVNLRVGNAVTSRTLARPLLMASAPAPVRPARICNDCGTIEAVNVVETKGEGGYLGTIGGGVVGALLGSQVGGGKGRTAAEIAGAVGGAYAGHAIEGNARRGTHYEVVVRMQNGGTQTVSMEANPGLAVGERVRVGEGVVTRDQ